MSENPRTFRPRACSRISLDGHSLTKDTSKLAASSGGRGRAAVSIFTMGVGFAASTSPKLPCSFPRAGHGQFGTSGITGTSAPVIVLPCISGVATFSVGPGLPCPPGCLLPRFLRSVCHVQTELVRAAHWHGRPWLCCPRWLQSGLRLLLRPAGARRRRCFRDKRGARGKGSAVR